MAVLASLKSWAKALKRDVVALWIAARDSRTSWHAKALAAFVAAYALSPIDLIPDFVPIVGYLDDLLIVPAGIALAVRLIPPVLMTEFRAAAANQTPPRTIAGLVIIFGLWAGGLVAVGWMIWGRRHN
ncbi:MAG: DUF1232 domain-containing protein [Devosia sp.]|nr:DUF1232 domain-containing protein [Devosia sp.]